MIRRAMKRLRNEDRGATAVEYSVFVGLIAAVVVLAVASLGGATSSNLDCTGKAWESKTAACTSSSSTVTPSPTTAPTVSPTVSPTVAPTTSPSSAPSPGNGNGND